MNGVEIFYGTFAATAGSFFKSLQPVDMPDFNKMKADINEFINRDDIEVITINHQCDNGMVSVLVYYKKKK